MLKEEFLKFAFKEAQKSKELIKCGAVVVKAGKIIASAHNQQREKHDASAHAEIIALRLAGKRLGNKNLKDCIIYSTCEPCIMCLSAIIFTDISKVFYNASLKETFPDNLPIRLTSLQLIKRSKTKLDIRRIAS